MGDIWVLKKRLVKASRVLENEGLIDHFGHASVRVPGKDAFLIKPGFVSNATLKEEEILLIDFTARKLEGEKKPPREAIMHAAIYRRRPEVNGVVHSHPPMVVSLASTGKEGLPLYNQTAVFYDRVPIFETPDLIGTDELAAALIEKMDKRVAVMIQGHGATTVGKSVEDAAINSIYLEKNAHMQLMAYSSGNPKPLEREYAKGYVENVHEPLFDHIWNYYEERLERGVRS
ncbi:MAG: class II aldolase/adducin family protein [Candidatus Binatia bacterium]